MIKFLRVLKEEFQNHVEEVLIADNEDEIIHSLPKVLLTPIEEIWTYNSLGNPDKKVIRFKILYFDEHIPNSYDIEIERIVEKIKEVLKSDKILSEVVIFNSTNIGVELLENETQILVTANVNLKLHRR